MSTLSRTTLAAVLVALASTVLSYAPAGAAGDAGIAVVAHRGNSGAAPENTLTSFAQGIAARADYVEFDVRLTRDGVPVLLHDESLARTTNVESRFPARRPWYVQAFTSTEVHQLDAGGWKAASYAGERIPTFRATLRQLAQSPVGAFVEIKDPPKYGGVDGIGTKVHDALHQLWPEAFADPGRPRAVMQSFDADFVRQYAAKYPDDPVGVIGVTRPDQVSDFSDGMQADYRTVTPDMASSAHALGLTLGAYTVNDSAVMAQLASQDLVDNVTGNYPAMLRTVVDDSGRTYHGTSWPARTSATPTWRVTTGGRYLNTRIPLTASLTLPDGSPARWQAAEVQTLQDGGWRTTLTRATDADGTFTTNVAGTAGLRVRVVSTDDLLYPAAASSASSPVLVKMASDLALSGPVAVRPRHSARLAVRWHASDGRPLSGAARLYKRRVGGSWHFVRTFGVSAGAASVTVHPRHTMQYQARGPRAWWHWGAAGSTAVRVSR